MAAITSSIEKAGFNIITSLSRLYEHGTEAQSEFVLQPVREPRKGATETALKKQLEECLATPDLVETYGIRIGYPRGYIVPLKTKRLVCRRTKDTEAAPTRRSPKEIR